MHYLSDLHYKSSLGIHSRTSLGHMEDTNIMKLVLKHFEYVLSSYQFNEIKN